MRLPFLGGSKKSRSLAFDAQRTVNLFPELDKTSKGGIALFMVYGKVVWGTVTEVGVRGMWPMGDYLYAAIGPTFYRFDVSGSGHELGTLKTGSGPVSISDNGSQVMLVDGPNGYIYDTTAATFSQITDADFGGGTHVDYFDTYFVVGPQGRQSFQISANGDGTGWVSSDIAPAEGRPDSLLTVLVYNRQLWLLGEESTEVFWDSGNNDFPFERIDGGFLEHGIAAPHSAAAGDNAVFWLSRNKNGFGQVVRSSGGPPEFISNRALEAEIQSYSRVDDALGWIYQQDGHTFYSLTFPEAQKTWVYDLSVQDPDIAWHERNSRVGSTDLGRDIANCHAYFKGMHLVGDYRNGRIYRLKNDVYTENGESIVWQRTGQYVHADNEPISFGCFEVDMEVGVGLPTGQGIDPQVALDWSDDEGKTWSNQLYRSMGAVGKTKTPIEWRKLGSSRHKGRLFRLSGSDPVKTVITNAYCDMDAG